MDKEIKQEFNTLKQFLVDNMVTKTDFNELKNEMIGLKENVSKLTAAIENLATTIKSIAEEHTVMKHQILAMQEWIKEASKKLGIEFKL